jgi:hypothetical protein
MSDKSLPTGAYIDRLLADYDKAEQVRDPWKTIWQDCYDYALPMRGENFYGSNQPGQKRTDKIYDETAVVSLQEFASRMQAGLVPNYTRWAMLQAGSDVPPGQTEDVNTALEEVTSYIFDIIDASNFSQEAHECFLDLGIGTCGLLVEEGDIDHPVKFTAIPLTQLILESGPFDAVHKVFRSRPMKGSIIEVNWPAAQIPKNMAREIKADPNKEYTIVEAVWRDWAVKGDEVYSYCVLCKEHKVELTKGAFKGAGSNPWIIARWSKCAGETYGRGPLMNALAAVKTCNAVVELILRNADMAISGMWQVEDDGTVNVDAIELVPGALIPHGHDSRGLQPLQAGGNFDVSQLILSDMRANIKKALYDEMLGPLDKTPMSAAEVHARMADMARRVGSSFGRLQYEFVQPVIKRVIHILKKQGRIKLPTVNGREVRVTATSPLSRSQNYEEVTAIDRWLEVLATRFGPQMVNIVVKSEELAGDLGNLLGVPGKYARSEPERKQLAEQIAQLGQAAVQGGADPAQLIKQALP